MVRDLFGTLPKKKKNTHTQSKIKASERGRGVGGGSGLTIGNGLIYLALASITALFFLSQTLTFTKKTEKCTLMPLAAFAPLLIFPSQISAKFVASAAFLYVLLEKSMRDR